jgi:hypothetical protein
MLFLGIAVRDADADEATQQQHATRITRSRRSRGRLQALLAPESREKGQEGQGSRGGLLLRGVIALGPGSDASGRRGADRSRRKPRREEGKKATCSDRRFG